MTIPEGALKVGDTQYHPCEFCKAMIILVHDADYELHLEWHRLTRTDMVPG